MRREERATVHGLIKKPGGGTGVRAKSRRREGGSQWGRGGGVRSPPISWGGFRRGLLRLGMGGSIERPTERSDPTQQAKGRTGDRPGPRKETTTGRNVTRGGGVQFPLFHDTYLNCAPLAPHDWHPRGPAHRRRAGDGAPLPRSQVVKKFPTLAETFAGKDRKNKTLLKLPMLVERFKMFASSKAGDTRSSGAAHSPRSARADPGSPRSPNALLSPPSTAPKRWQFLRRDVVASVLAQPRAEFDDGILPQPSIEIEQQALNPAAPPEGNGGGSGGNPLTAAVRGRKGPAPRMVLPSPMAFTAPGPPRDDPPPRPAAPAPEAAPHPPAPAPEAGPHPPAPAPEAAPRVAAQAPEVERHLTD